MNILRRILCLASLIVLIVFAGGFSEALAKVDYAGLVIRQGDDRITYGYVPLSDEITGIELIERAGVSLVTIGFGGLGEGVCSIEGKGCGIGDCRKRMCQQGGADSPYWRYFRETSPGVWTAAVLGGSSTKVMAGQIDGWDWTADEPNLPTIAIEEIPALAGIDTEHPEQAAIATYSANGERVTVSGKSKSRLVYGATGALFALLVVALVYVNLRKPGLDAP